MSFFVYCPNYTGLYQAQNNSESAYLQPVQSNFYSSNSQQFMSSFFSMPYGFSSNYGLMTEMNQNQNPEPELSPVLTRRQIGIERIQEKNKKKKRNNLQKELQSAKKNGQSNLINHFFSYFGSRQKSDALLEQILSTYNKSTSQKEVLFHLFYNTVQLLNIKRGRKYVNHDILLPLLTSDQLQNMIPEIKQKVSKLQNISLDDICLLMRKCILYFYRNKSISLIMTSRRISQVAKIQHLKRRRKISRKLFCDTGKKHTKKTIISDIY